MKLELQRTIQLADRVLGTLSVNGQPLCDTLEPANCIPTGTYELRITWSPRYKRFLPLVMDVPGRKGIRIHSGNLPEDTKGCILVGQHQQNYLINSKETMSHLMQQIKKHENEVHTISII